MPKSPTKAPSKAQAIREALKQYPDKGPTAIAHILSKRLGMPVRAKHVTVIKSKERNSQAPRPAVIQAAARRTEGRSNPAKPRVAEIVTTLQSYIERLGKEDLHRLIDAL